ncbi:MAG: hypothetical protein Q8Q73_01660 [Stagnimonas sp.]|nr:hypothetical protein [Stagnimonas sp.]
MSKPDQPRSSKPGSLDEFVAAGASLPDTPVLQAFVHDACLNSGLDPARLHPDEASYSLLLPDGEVDGLRLDSSLDYEDELLRLGDLLSPQLRHGQTSLARAVWALDSFESLRDFLQALRVLLRYSRDEEQRLVARVLPVAATLRLVEQVEQNQHLGGAGELVVDSVTRMLGLRRKLLLLDYNRRLNDGKGSNGGGLLARTRSLLMPSST